MQFVCVCGRARPSVLHGTHIEDLTRVFDEGTQLVTVPYPIPQEALTALETGRAGQGWKQAVPIDAEGVPDADVLRGLDPRDDPSSERLRGLVSEILDIVASLFGADETRGEGWFIVPPPRSGSVAGS